MRYMVERNFVQVVGKGWYGQLIATEISLSPYDYENIADMDEANFTRENVEGWLATHAGDFQEIDDFFATYGNTNLDWASEEGEFAYQDMVNPNEE